jgi:hypothetical protein
MVVPSGLADSLNLPGIMGMAGAGGLAREASADAVAQVVEETIARTHVPG